MPWFWKSKAQKKEEALELCDQAENAKKLGQKEEALNLLNESIRKFPSIRAYFERGQLYDLTGKNANAFNDYYQAVRMRLNKENDISDLTMAYESAILAAKFDISKHRYDNSLYFTRIAMEGAKRLKDSNIQRSAYKAIGDAHFAQHKSLHALTAYRKATELGEDDPEILARIEDLKIKLQDSKESVHGFDMATWVLGKVAEMAIDTLLGL